MSDLTAFVVWWLLLQAAGLVALPLVFRLLRWLPDRGYSVAKPAGLLLGNYVLWLLGSLGWIRNTAGGLLLSFGLVTLAGVWAYRRWDDGPGLAGWLRSHKAWVVAYEAVFLLAFAGWAVFRAHNPDLSTTEKPMEFAFMNAIDRSAAFPPSDPWLSGFGISYYYFGYVMMSTLMKASSVNPGVAFSLSNALWFALTAAGAFGIAANLAAASRRATTTVAVATGLLGALFVSVLGNFQGPLEVAHANGQGSAEFWRWLDVQEINTQPIPLAPGEVRWPNCNGEACPGPPRGTWWFWRASRVVHDYPLGSDRSDPAEYQEVIDEFPFFSFLLGDMHPHVLALPYALLSLALAFNLFRWGAASDAGGSARDNWRRWFWTAAPIAVAYPILLGALSFLNTWDFPIQVFIVALVWGLGRWVAGRSAAPSAATRARMIWLDAALAFVACGIIGVVAYLPFYLGLRSQAAGLAPNLYNPTRLPQFFVMFGPFLIIGGGFIAVLATRAVRLQRWTAARALAAAFGGGALIVAVAALATAALSGLAFVVSGGAQAKFQEWEGLIAAQGIRLDQVLAERAVDLALPLARCAVVLTGAVLLWLAARAGLTRGLSRRYTSTLERLPPRLSGLVSWLVGGIGLVGLIALIAWVAGEVTAALLGIGIAGVVMAWRSPRTNGAGEADAMPFALALFGVGALLTLAVEYVYLLDQFGTRMNTVFKFYYQAWALWAVASAFAVFYLLGARERIASAAGRLAFAGVVVMVVLAGLVYPVLALQSGTLGRPLHEVADPATGGVQSVPIDPTLDARAPTQLYAADEVAAAAWLQANADPGAVILESPGASYQSHTSRLSAWTGVPGVLGWVGHEGQWRGVYEDITPRISDIDLIYSTLDSSLALDRLRQYGVEYVYVGPNERSKYPAEGLAKFTAVLAQVFQQGESTLYQMPGADRVSR